MNTAKNLLNNINNGIPWDDWSLDEQNVFCLCFQETSRRDSQTQEHWEQEKNHLSMKLFNRLGTDLPRFIVAHLSEFSSINSCDRLSVIAGEVRQLLLEQAKPRKPTNRPII